MTVNVNKLLQTGERYMGSKVNNIGGKTIFVGKIGERGNVIKEIVTDAVGNVVKMQQPQLTPKVENIIAYTQKIL